MSFIGEAISTLALYSNSLYWEVLSIALFGVIAASGLKILVEHKIDFDNKKNLLIASVILVSGIGGLMIAPWWTSNHWCRNVNNSWDCVVSNPSRTKS